MGRGGNSRVIDLITLFDILRYKTGAETKLLRPLAWQLFGTMRTNKIKRIQVKLPNAKV